MVHNQKTILPTFFKPFGKVLPPRWQSLAIGMAKFAKLLAKACFLFSC